MFRVLVIDDEPQIRDMLSRIFEGAGYECYTANNGITGANQFGRMHFDVVITDIIMPGKEGLETISDMRKLSEGVKIVAISGGGQTASSSYLKIAEKMGADAVLSKPFGKNEILAVVGNLLQSGDKE